MKPQAKAYLGSADQALAQAHRFMIIASVSSVLVASVESPAASAGPTP
jgi:hypothetical protein